MNTLLFGLGLASVLSSTSLFVVLFRVSPLTAPLQALPAFFCSIFLSVASIGSLTSFVCWRRLRVHYWDEGKTLSIALRQGIFLGVATVILVLFHLLGILTWWAAICIYAVFLLIELALHS